MSGAPGHFFDPVYYPCSDATVRRVLRALTGNGDTARRLRAVATITGQVGAGAAGAGGHGDADGADRTQVRGAGRCAGATVVTAPLRGASVPSGCARGTRHS